MFVIECEVSILNIYILSNFIVTVSCFRHPLYIIFSLRFILYIGLPPLQKDILHVTTTKLSEGFLFIRLMTNDILFKSYRKNRNILLQIIQPSHLAHSILFLRMESVEAQD